MKYNKRTGQDLFRPLYPFSPHYVTVRGLRMHYVDEGQGPTVLMVHGNPTWSFYFRSLVLGLRGRCRVIAPDHIGCGLSEKPLENRYDYRLKSRVEDLETLIETVNPQGKLTLVVHDWGGMITLAWAVRHPEKIGRIVLFNTAAFPPPADKRIPWQLWVVRNLTPLAVPLVLGLNLFARGAIVMAPRKRLSRQVRSGLLFPYDSWHHRIATLRFVQDIPLASGDPGFDIIAETAGALHRLSSVPMLVCWGMHDFVFDGDYLAEWRRRFPSAEVHEFHDAGHYLLEDEPDAVLGTVLEFFEKNPIR